jgi:hypothetical protein
VPLSIWESAGKRGLRSQGSGGMARLLSERGKLEECPESGAARLLSSCRRVGLRSAATAARLRHSSAGYHALQNQRSCDRAWASLRSRIQSECLLAEAAGHIALAAAGDTGSHGAQSSPLDSTRLGWRPRRLHAPDAATKGGNPCFACRLQPGRDRCSFGPKSAVCVSFAAPLASCRAPRAPPPSTRLLSVCFITGFYVRLIALINQPSSKRATSALGGK